MTFTLEDTVSHTKFLVLFTLWCCPFLSLAASPDETLDAVIESETAMADSDAATVEAAEKKKWLAEQRVDSARRKNEASSAIRDAKKQEADAQRKIQDMESEAARLAKDSAKDEKRIQALQARLQDLHKGHAQAEERLKQAHDTRERIANERRDIERQTTDLNERRKSELIRGVEARKELARVQSEFRKVQRQNQLAENRFRSVEKQRKQSEPKMLAEIKKLKIQATQLDRSRAKFEKQTELLRQKQEQSQRRLHNARNEVRMKNMARQKAQSRYAEAKRISGQRN